MRPRGRPSVWLPLAAAARAAVVCCAGPTLLVLTGTGLGVGVVHAGASLLAGIGVVAALSIGGLVWWRRRACASSVVPTPQRFHESPR
jgi:hypothetical protein